MDNKQYIMSVLDKRTLLEQLQEEAAELIKAASKVMRAEGLNNNVTPVSVGEANLNLQEEFSDVLAVGELLGLIDCQDESKLERWAERLRSEENDKTYARTN